MKRLFIVAILVVLLAVIMLGCTRNNTPGNTVGPSATMYPATPTDVIPGVTNTPGGTVESPIVTMSPSVSPGAGVTTVPEATMTTSPAAS